MYLFAVILVSIVVYAVFVGVLKACDKMGRNKVERKMLKVLCMGILCVLFFGAMIVLMSIFPNDTAEWWVYLIFSLFLLLGLILMLIAFLGLCAERKRKK